MKKSLLALAAMTAFAGVASAQSSVTLFGIVDLAARNVKNGNAGSLKTLSTNGQASSRLGIRGVEDLGGGLRAGFWLEGDISADVGGGQKTAATANGSAANGQDWQRRSTVSLIGSFGEVRLGRDYTPAFNAFVSHDIFSYVGVASSANLRTAFLGSGGATTAVRANNAISYFLPAMGGLYGQVMIAAAEGAATAPNGYTGFRLGYAAGPINGSFVMGKTKKSGAAIDDVTTLFFGGSYNAGFATFHATYEKADYSVLTRKLATVSAVIPMGTGAFKAQYAKAGGNSATPPATLIGLGYVQGLSKRTSLYGNFGRVSNSGPASVGVVYTASSGGPTGMRRNQTSTGYEFGIRHDF
jgi:predicted porin